MSHTSAFDDVNQRAAYFALFSTLLFALALKSNFEALEISGFGAWATIGTVVSVVGASPSHSSEPGTQESTGANCASPLATSSH
jgi:hypothetical protein